ncbi:JmjC domain-containing protein [Promicromonospora sp. NFX87]|uniref:JmjC domain-containing protein n=1 Tax=Promicromonospora sp. NFX87 TaxID=3402691 RepID=UPI003AFB4C6D
MASIRVPQLSDLVGDTDVFFEDYFNRKPMIRLGALKSDATELLSAEMLDELLVSDAIRPPYIAVTKSGELVHPRTYTETRRIQRDTITDAVIPTRVIEHFKTGATITWSSLNHYLPHIRQLTRGLSEAFGTRSDAVGFVTPAGRRGFKPHRDSVDVFVIQTEGTKDWLLWNPSLQRDGVADWYSLEELGEPDHRITLQPGDVLYLPFGTPHCASATETTSVHLSLMVKSRRWRDILVDLVTEAVSSDLRFAGNPLLDPENEKFEIELRSAVEALSGKLSAVHWRDAIRNLRSMPHAGEGSTANDFFTSQMAADSLGASSALRRRTGAHVSVQVDEGASDGQLEVNGSTYRVPRAAIDLVKRILDGETIRIDELDGAPNQNVDFARSIVRLEIAEVVGGSD